MLKVSRRLGESIMVGDEVKVAILDVKGNQIRLGIEAPRDVTILREELYPSEKSNSTEDE